MRILGKERGQTLIEILGALAIALIVILALVRVTITSMRNASLAKNQALATQYAQEGMEGARGYRDQNSWDTFWSDKVPSTEGPTTVGDIFSRTIEYEDASVGVEDRAKVTVTVSWTDAAGSHQSELTSYLTKWQ